MNDEARREFTALAASEPVALAKGALLIAKEEYPDLSVDQCLNRLAELAREAERWVGTGANTIEQIQNLSQFLFEQQHFAGNRNSYGDPRNSFLNEVLERSIFHAERYLIRPNRRYQIAPLISGSESSAFSARTAATMRLGSCRPGA